MDGSQGEGRQLMFEAGHCPPGSAADPQASHIFEGLFKFFAYLMSRHALILVHLWSQSVQSFCVCVCILMGITDNLIAKLISVSLCLQCVRKYG